MEIFSKSLVKPSGPVEKQMGGCAVIGFMNYNRKRESGERIIQGIAVMRERANGLGGGFAAYGIYPDYADLWVFHLMYDDKNAQESTENYLKEYFYIEKSEIIPVRHIKEISRVPLMYRYFIHIKEDMLAQNPFISEEDYIIERVMYINAQIRGAFVCSSGKNMGVFKGVGYPEDIGRLFRLEEYEAYTWISHGRFPTNSVGWWGGAHPFGLINWSIVHNGEISSYGINKRYLENFGYYCTLSTDTEVITYLFDLLVRKHHLPFEIVAKIIAPPLWSKIEKMPEEEKELYKTLRIIYASALLNGPFSVIVGFENGMLGINDRIKLRPLVAGKTSTTLYISSEEAAIREIEENLEDYWMPDAGELVIGFLKEK